MLEICRFDFIEQTVLWALILCSMKSNLQDLGLIQWHCRLGGNTYENIDYNSSMHSHAEHGNESKNNYRKVYTIF